LPAPFGPRKADDLSLADLEDDRVDRADLAVLAADEALRRRAQARLPLGDRERLVQLGDADAGSAHGVNLDDSPVRILLVSQMYPSPAAPDFGVFVQGLERELPRAGTSSSASCSTAAAAASCATRARGAAMRPRAASGRTSSTPTSSSRPGSRHARARAAGRRSSSPRTAGRRQRDAVSRSSAADPRVVTARRR
jgi:hypothetical protein